MSRCSRLRLWRTWSHACGRFGFRRLLISACVSFPTPASTSLFTPAIRPTVRGRPGSIVGPPHRSFIVGSTLRSFIVRSAGCGHVVGASLLPTGVQPLLGVPARIIGDNIALLDDILGSTAGEIEDSILAGTGDRCLARLGDALVRLAAAREAHSVAARAVHRVRTAGGQKRMDVLADETNLSMRQLERVFREHVGLSPKTYSRLVRFDGAARGLHARGTLSWTHFALAHGYGDQAHFINDFKEFAGVTPAQFEAELAAGELRSH